MAEKTSRARVARRAFLCLSTVLASGLAAPALAQSAPAPESRKNVDEMGVDQVTGSFNWSLVEGDVGTGSKGIELIRFWGRSGWEDNWSGDLRVASNGVLTITFGNRSSVFVQVNGIWANSNDDGSKLMRGYDPSGGFISTYTSPEGTTITFKDIGLLAGTGGSELTIYSDSGGCSSANSIGCGVPVDITQPDGSGYSLTWDTPAQCQESNPDPWNVSENPIITCSGSYRLKDVRSKSSYAMKIKYQSEVQYTPSWHKRDSVKFFDLGQVYCDPSAQNCEGVASAGSIAYSYPNTNTVNVTDERAGTWVLTTNSSGQLDTRNNRDFGGAMIQFVGAG